MMMSPSAPLGSVAKGAGMSGEAAGEFEAALRAQIADSRAELALARSARDIEAITAAGLRLRYLLEVAADSGLRTDEASDADEPSGTAGAREPATESSDE